MSATAGKNTYPSRLKGNPIFDPNGHKRSGKTFWVGGSATILSSFSENFEVGSDDNDGESPDRPLATIDAAINKCSNGRGDTIYVMGGYAETISTAAAIDIDVDGISIIGLQSSFTAPKPLIISDTATATVEINATDVYIENINFVGNVASQATMVNLVGGAYYVTIKDCNFQDNAKDVVSSGITISNATIGINIIDCKFWNTPANSNTVDAIDINAAASDITIRGCYFQGPYSGAAIDSVAAILRFRCYDNQIINLTAGQHAVQIAGTTATGLITDNVFGTNAVATAVDPGGCYVGTNQFASAADKWPIDFNILGTNDANNTYDSTTVEPNRDGSIIERIEFIYDALVDDATTNLIGVDDASNLGTTASVTADRDGSIVERLEDLRQVLTGESGSDAGPLGLSVTKTGVSTDATADIFTVTGKNLITLVHGEMTTAETGATTSLTAKLNVKTGDVDICAATAIIGDAINTLYILTGDPVDLLNNGATPAADLAHLNADTWLNPFILDGDTIEMTIAKGGGTSAGVIQWTMHYIPLEASASIAAA